MDLNLSDNFLFAQVMTDTNICKLVLEKILDVEIDHVEILENEKTIQVAYGAKGIRLDVYLMDDKQTVYNVEMQQSNTGDLRKRSRYYLGMLDLDLISPGESYEKLKKSYVIFICTFDLFGQGRHIYTFENTCKQDSALYLGDESYKIFLSTKGTMDDVSTDLLEFLRFVENTSDEVAEQANSDLVQRVNRKVKEIKNNREMEEQYMTLLHLERERYREGLQEGIQKGEERKLLELIRRKATRGQTPEQIADALEEPVSVIEELMKQL